MASFNLLESTQLSIDVPVKDPDAVGIPIEFLDFTNQKDNSSYVPDLTQGILQPCEVVEEDEDVFLQNIDVEKLVHELTVTLETPEKNRCRAECFQIHSFSA